jgi:2-keto-4-pentenoate hydratase
MSRVTRCRAGLSLVRANGFFVVDLLPVTSETLVACGAPVRVSHLRAVRVETELVIEIAGAVEAGAPSEALQRAVAGLAVGLEIVDVARPPDDLEGIIASNVAHRACVLGRTRTEPGGLGTARIWMRARAGLRKPIVDLACSVRINES